MKTRSLLPPQTVFDWSVWTALTELQIPDAGRVRPTMGLRSGQVFFDTVLGKPVWWNGSAWVDATGVSV